MYLRV